VASPACLDWCFRLPELERGSGEEEEGLGGSRYGRKYLFSLIALPPKSSPTSRNMFIQKNGPLYLLCLLYFTPHFQRFYFGGVSFTSTSQMYPKRYPTKIFDWIYFGLSPRHFFSPHAPLPVTRAFSTNDGRPHPIHHQHYPKLQGRSAPSRLGCYWRCCFVEVCFGSECLVFDVA
jgi:hypothetical protein